MDAETLEKLLLDRALGALSPEVEALLTAYLDHDVEAAGRAREFQAAALTARSVLGAEGSVRLPDFPAMRIEKLEVARRRLRVLRNVTGIAASLVLGIGLGAGLARQLDKAPASGGAGGMTQVAASVRLEVAPPRSDGFWSARRLYERARSARRDRGTRLIWDSPVTQPRLGDET